MNNRNRACAVLEVLVYSSNSATRSRVEQALGGNLDNTHARLRFTHVATESAVLRRMRDRPTDCVILDGEASPAGGLGVARQLKDELREYIPMVVLLGREQDEWLARWSQVDDVVVHPIDPIALADAVVPLLRRRIAS
jgi:CheY-like chemotaxis protein